MATSAVATSAVAASIAATSTAATSSVPTSASSAAATSIAASAARVMRNARSRVLSRLPHAAAVACACVLAACATVDATTTQYVGVPRFAPTVPAAVQILRVEPRRPHERLGEIVVDASTDPAPPIEQVENKLREEGAKIGADAVVVVVDRIQPVGAYVSGPWWGGSIQTITGRKLIGVAIKYR